MTDEQKEQLRHRQTLKSLADQSLDIVASNPWASFGERLEDMLALQASCEEWIRAFRADILRQGT